MYFNRVILCECRSSDYTSLPNIICPDKSTNPRDCIDLADLSKLPEDIRSFAKDSRYINTCILSIPAFYFLYNLDNNPHLHQLSFKIAYSIQHISSNFQMARISHRRLRCRAAAKLSALARARKRAENMVSGRHFSLDITRGRK